MRGAGLFIGGRHGGISILERYRAMRLVNGSLDHGAARNADNQMRQQTIAASKLHHLGSHDWGVRIMKGKSRSLHRKNIFRRKALALAIGAVTFSLANTAWSQATSGTIYGTVPAAAGETIQITGGAGFNRTIEG